MREAELANLLVQMGLDRGLSIEQVAAELSTLSLPTFVDTSVFRAQVLQAAETRLRAQVEAQINRLRQQAGLGTGAGSASGASPFASTSPPSSPVVPPMNAVSSSPEPLLPPVVQSSQPPESASVDSGVPDLAAVVASLGNNDQPAGEPEIELPADATVVWTNFDANRGRSGS